MSQTLPESALPASASSPFSVGDRFTFVGLPGQEPGSSRMVGSRAVGWVVEVVHASAFGTIGVRCAPSAEDLDARPQAGTVGSVGFADAVAMIRHGVWQPLT